jgi:hypothetical protein
MKVLRGGDAARVPELFGATASDPAKNIEVTDIRAGSGPVLGSGRTESELKQSSGWVCNFGCGRRLTMYNQLYNVNGQLQYWVVWKAQVLVFFGTWANDRVDISGNGNWNISGATYFWNRTTLYRHTHEELVCNGCNASLSNCPGGNCFTSATLGRNETWGIDVQLNLQ